ncbi:DUF3039 domain-containing protein [Saccharopolyspora shandongensis]|uniref:DUF3039 domain-containing protein n=1 Tax=Saccharopolyspora shandongensis TaxID=418495 RepID=UPI0033C998C3
MGEAQRVDQAVRGGTVVSGLCGEIGWGPDERPPDGWPMCSECIEIAFEEIS